MKLYLHKLKVYLEDDDESQIPAVDDSQRLTIAFSD